MQVAGRHGIVRRRAYVYSQNTIYEWYYIVICIKNTYTLEYRCLMLLE